MLEDKLNLEELQKRLLDNLVIGIMQAENDKLEKTYIKQFIATLEYTKIHYPKLFKEYKVFDYGRN